MRKRNRKVKVMGLAGMLMVGLAAGSLPAGSVSAANGWEVDLNAGGSVEASSVSITMGGATNGQLNAGSTDPNKSAGLVKRTASVEIGATDGYTVTLSGNPNLTGINSSNKIPTVTSNTTLAQMNNQWGWYTAEGDVDCSALQTMKQMKSTGDQIAAGTLNAKTTKQFTMCFGAKVNGNQAADTYSNTVTLSVVAQPKVVQTFGGIKTMQEMTSSICSAAAVNDTAYLRDTRDNKSYWVTKLADGNCWMSQNLDLDITTSNVKAADSDVASDWTPSKVTASSLSSTSATSWDLGRYVQSVAPTSGGARSCSNSVGLSICSEKGLIDVSAWVASTDSNFYRRELYSGTDGSTCTKSANSAINADATGACRVYDAHYLVGNYYTWKAATAETSSGSDGGATGSICPKNWRLSRGNSAENSELSSVLQQYGVSSSYTGTGVNGAMGASGLTYSIVLSPLFYVQSGYINPTGNYWLNNAGATGRYWTSRSAHILELYSLWSLGVSLNYGYSYPNLGQSMRCLVEAS